MREVECIWCYKKFNKRNSYQRRCDECLQLDAKKKSSKKKIKSIWECINIIEKYNKEHKTCYTYGNFPFEL